MLLVGVSEMVLPEMLVSVENQKERTVSVIRECDMQILESDRDEVRFWRPHEVSIAQGVQSHRFVATKYLYRCVF